MIIQRNGISRNQNLSIVSSELDCLGMSTHAVIKIAITIFASDVDNKSITYLVETRLSKVSHKTKVSQSASML